MRSHVLRAFAVCASLSAFLCASRAQAAPGGQSFDANERRAIAAGERVERPLDFSTSEGSYVGGMAYQVVARAPEVVLSDLLDPEKLAAMLPNTRAARVLRVDQLGTHIELEQGRSPFAVRYTIVVESRPSEGRLRFWMDQRSPHDIRDVWGFFRATPFGKGRTLLSLGAAVDLGPGLLAMLFQARIRAVVLASVTRFRDFMQP